MKIQILHVRHPDEGCHVRVFIEGQEVTVSDIEDIDPGRGWLRSEWNDRLAEFEVAEETPFNSAVHEALLAAADSSYIDD